MDSPQTINGLMRHLRNDCKIQISGSYEKKQLISYGYYHGYKGYRFFKKPNDRIPFTKFSEVVAVIEYDNNLKAALYPNLMFIETAIKNIVCNESVNGLKLATFEHVYKERMHDELTNTELQSKRLKLRNSVYSKLSSSYRSEQYSDNQMVRHYYNQGIDAPLWVVFEKLYLGELADFFNCLNKSVREGIMNQLSMLDKSVDTQSELLGTLLYTIKSLRNAVAHNNVIFDTRFKDRNISRHLRKWIEKEVNTKNVTLYSLIDYIIIVCCLLKRIDFSATRAKQLVEAYKSQNDLLKNTVSPKIYHMIITGQVTQKIIDLEKYLNKPL